MFWNCSILYHHQKSYGSWVIVCSLDASCGLVNKSAERLCSFLTKYAVEGRETNIWREYGVSLTALVTSMTVSAWHRRVWT
jgi:hypothetical protein